MSEGHHNRPRRVITLQLLDKECGARHEVEVDAVEFVAGRGVGFVACFLYNAVDSYL